MTDNDAADVGAVEALVRRVWERFAAQDPDGMLACMDAACTVWDVFQAHLVRAATMREYVAVDYEQSAARGALTYSMRDFVTDVWGDAAIVRFYLDFAYEAPNALSGGARITCVLRRFADGGWLVVHVHEGALPAGVPEITE